MAQPSIRPGPLRADSAATAWTPSEIPSSAHAVHAGGSEPPQTGLSDEEHAALVNEAYQRGIAEGEARATAAADARFRDATTMIARAVTHVEEVASLAPAVLEENIAAIAVIVARQIVAREVALDRELIADLVRRALTEFPIDQTVRIRVHPLDLAVLSLGGGQGSSPITGTRDASWLADARVSRGGCLIEGRDRIIDGRVDAALERAYRRMAQIDAS